MSVTVGTRELHNSSSGPYASSKIPTAYAKLASFGLFSPDLAFVFDR